MPPEAVVQAGASGNYAYLTIWVLAAVIGCLVGFSVWAIRYGVSHYEHLATLGRDQCGKPIAQRKHEVTNGGPPTGLAEILVRIIDLHTLSLGLASRVEALEQWRCAQTGD